MKWTQVTGQERGLYLKFGIMKAAKPVKYKVYCYVVANNVLYCSWFLPLLAAINIRFIQLFVR